MSRTQSIHLLKRLAERVRLPVRLPALGATLLIACAACGGERARPGTPPRCLLLLTLENLRADHVMSQGYIRETTRVRKESSELVLDIDRMAETGVSFQQAYAPCPEVYSSLASLHSGATPIEHGALQRAAALSADVSTLAEGFAASGFTTAAFVGASSPLLTPELARGFATSAEFATDLEVLKAAMAWLEQHASAESRLLLWVHLGELREPFDGEPLRDLYRAPGEVEGALELRPEAFTDDERGRLLRRRVVDRYDGALFRSNQLLHAFLENYRFGFLAEQLFDDSVIAICGTNGLELAEREGRVGVTGALTDETLHVPLILRHPGSMTGSRIFSEIVTLEDLAPTVRDWFGLAPANAGSGRNLLAITDSYIEREFEARPAHAWSTSEGVVRAQSLRDAEWRAVFDDEGAQLYDLTRDPYAMTDVAGRFPQRVDTWRARLDPLPVQE